MRISDWSSDVCSSDLVAESHGNGREIFAEKGKCLLAGERCVAKIVPNRSEERRVGKECVVRVDLGGRRIIKKKKEDNRVKHVWTIIITTDTTIRTEYKKLTL